MPGPGFKYLKIVGAFGTLHLDPNGLIWPFFFSIGLSTLDDYKVLRKKFKINSFKGLLSYLNLLKVILIFFNFLFTRKLLI